MISMAVTYLFDNIGEGLPFVPFVVLMKQDREIDVNVAIPPGTADRYTGACHSRSSQCGNPRLVEFPCL